LDDTRTVQQHLEACKSVENLLTDSNAMVTRLAAALRATRDTLEALLEYQHPKLAMLPPYHLRANSDPNRSAPPAAVIACQVKRINELLGDRA